MPGCEGSRCCSDVLVCLMSGFQVQVSMVSAGQVSRGSEAQVSASMVLESRAKNPCVPTSPEGRWIWGDPRITLKSHQIWSQSPGQQKSWKLVPRTMRNPISAKVGFCNTSFAKYLFFQSQPSRFRPKNQQKKKPGDKHEQTPFFKSEVLKKPPKWDP